MFVPSSGLRRIPWPCPPIYLPRMLTAHCPHSLTHLLEWRFVQNVVDVGLWCRCAVACIHIFNASASSFEKREREEADEPRPNGNDRRSERRCRACKGGFSRSCASAFLASGDLGNALVRLRREIVKTQTYLWQTEDQMGAQSHKRVRNPF